MKIRMCGGGSTNNLHVYDGEDKFVCASPRDVEGYIKKAGWQMEERYAVALLKEVSGTDRFPSTYPELFALATASGRQRRDAILAIADKSE